MPYSYQYTREIKHGPKFKPAEFEKAIALLIADANNPKGIKFDLGRWATPSTEADERPVLYDETGATPKLGVDCGTTGCAMGLFAVSGLWPDLKLRDRLYERPEACRAGLHVRLEPVLDIDPDKESGYVSSGFSAAARLFGISYEDATYLFDPECYEGLVVEAEGELLVAERMQAFLDGKVDPDYHSNEDDIDEDEEGDDINDHVITDELDEG